MSIPRHWIEWIDELKKYGIKRSRPECILDGLKSIKYGLDRELEQIKDTEALKEQRIEKDE